jgi:hypothetical protein
MNIKIINPAIDTRWDDFVNRQNQSTIFHTSAWAKVIQESYGYIPYYYVIEDDTKQLKAAIPFHFINSWLTGKRMICLPFSDYCYPIGDESADITLLLNAAKKEVESKSGKT